jgi:retron-type reverse transcriptase
MKHLEKNNILCNLLHGFRQNRSCETQIISLIHELASQHDKNTQIDLLIMDFAKAFDKVPHQRLLYKLRYYITPSNKLGQIIPFKQNTNSGPRKYNIR